MTNDDSLHYSFELTEIGLEFLSPKLCRNFEIGLSRKQYPGCTNTLIMDSWTARGSDPILIGKGFPIKIQEWLDHYDHASMQKLGEGFSEFYGMMGVFPKLDKLTLHVFAQYASYPDHHTVMYGAFAAEQTRAQRFWMAAQGRNSEDELDACVAGYALTWEAYAT
jgi:hypothetical protein